MREVLPNLLKYLIEKKKTMLINIYVISRIIRFIIVVHNHQKIDEI